MSTTNDSGEQQQRFVFLELDELTMRENIVASFVKDKEQHNIIARLNHRYSAKNIVSPINYRDWLFYYRVI